MISDLLEPGGGRSLLLMGNEAIVRGALEARVGVVTGYPGTPSSEVGQTFARLGPASGARFEWSVNEKVALELAFGSSLAGVRSLVSMKHLGLVYAGDPLSTIPYIGVVGGLVIVSAADPSCHTSPNEQDQRHIGRMLGIPTLDPASPEEARAMTRFAFELSEATELPVLLRITARVAHTRGAVTTADFGPDRPAARFVRQPERFVPVPGNARRLRLRLQERLEVANRMLGEASFCPTTPGTGRKGVVTTGAPHLLCVELLTSLGETGRVPLLRLGAVHPLPDRTILDFLATVDELLVVEELSPYLEDSLLAMAQHYHVPVRIQGKRSGTMPWPYEIGPDVLEPALRSFLELPPVEAAHPERMAPPLAAPIRPPTLCPGCPHSATFIAAKLVFGEDRIYVNDIGCYTLGFQPPHGVGDVLLSMGASLPIAAGLARATGQRSVAVMGDSTFFHSGLPALVNAVQQQDDVVLLVADNQATAMTGHQPSPSSPVNRAGQARPRRSIVEAARALGVESVEVIDPFDLPATIAAMTRARDASGPSVVVAEHACPFYAMGPARAAPREVRVVDDGRCHTCGMKETDLSCGLGETPELDRHVLARRAEERDLWNRAFPEGAPDIAPCTSACPIGICVQAYVGSIAVEKLEAALAAVTLRAALPSICSHVCHRPCEDRCIIGADPEGAAPSIAINELKRYLTDGAAVKITHPPCAPLLAGMPPVAVVGAGPAGLAAARELRRRGHRVVLFDGADRPGGALSLIPEHRLPRAVLRRDLEALFALGGIEFRGGTRLGRDLALADLRADGFAAVVLALGTGRVPVPAIPGADGPWATSALDFLADRAPPVSGDEDRLVVIGGGDVAIDVARTAVRRGTRVSLLALEQREDLPADPDTVIAAADEGVEIVTGVAVTSIAADEDRGCRLRAARVVSLETGEGGELRPRCGAEWGELRADRVVFATGLVPERDGLGGGDPARDAAGRILADPWGRTSATDVFVAGDVALGASTVTRALASGVRAAYAVDLALRPGVAPPCAAPMDRGDDQAGDQASGRRTARRRAAAATGAPPYGREAALAEARRCLLCARCARCDACMHVVGCPAFARGDGPANRIDATLCIGCDYCMPLCPNQAVSIQPVEPGGAA